MSNVVVHNLLLILVGAPLTVAAVWFTAWALVDPKTKRQAEPKPKAPARTVRALPVAPARKELTR